MAAQQTLEPFRIAIPDADLAEEAELQGARPQTLGERLFNITHWNDFDTGGHFAAMETPQLLVHDIRTFFATVT